MLAKQKSKQKSSDLEKQKLTKIKENKITNKNSDENNKTSKGNLSENQISIEEEEPDLLDFDNEESDFENYLLKKQKNTNLSNSLKKVLPESLINSLMGWKGDLKDHKELDVTKDIRKIIEPKYIEIKNDSQFFFGNYSSEMFQNCSQIWSISKNKASDDLQTLPYCYLKPEMSKCDTLMELNDNLISKNNNISELKVESFLMTENRQENYSDLKNKKQINTKFKKADKKINPKWKNIFESPQKGFNMEESFIKQLRTKDIEKILKIREKEENQHVPVILGDKSKNLKILKQLKQSSNKLFKKKFNIVSIKSIKPKENQDKQNIIKKIHVNKLDNQKILRGSNSNKDLKKSIFINI